MSKSGWKDTGEVQVLSFDVYGTLVDWEEGMRRVLEEEGVLEPLPGSWDEFLELRNRKEAELEAAPYRHYREILALSLQGAMRELGVRVSDPVALRFARTVPQWPLFPDTVSAMRRLGSYWPLCVVSNVDRKPLQKTLEAMNIPFAEVIAAEDVRSYKPQPAHFVELRRRLGKRQKGLIHVSTSVVHDLEPAQALGIPAIWVNRKAQKQPEGLEVRHVARDLMEVCTHLGV